MCLASPANWQVLPNQPFFNICLIFLLAWLTQSDLLRTPGIAPNLFKGKPGRAGQSFVMSADLIKGWLHQLWLAFTLVITRGCSWIGWHQIGIIRIKIWICLAFAITGIRRCTNSGVQVQCTQEGAPNIRPSLANTSTRHHKCTNIRGNYLRGPDQLSMPWPTARCRIDIYQSGCKWIYRSRNPT